MNMHLYSLSVSLVLSGDDQRRTCYTFDSRKCGATVYTR